ncbi:alkene reductase [Pararhizobium haloflavum]|uniref:alkene reductase n=1 Tax=Pararhizobium haloflavum TaxID=2037914 RepID=UPI0018E44936|nr:alkene reductase [Pararhizobium haloflavum]
MTHQMFSPTEMGELTIPNRIFMAPLTRNRANPDGTPKPLAATYYAQRASAGLIVSEATQISPLGKGYIDTPGIYTDAQVEAWKPITSAVHANGGRIFCQLWHVGRISHTSLLPDGQAPVSSSNRRARSKTFTSNGFEDTSKPRALEGDEIAALIEDYGHAARSAIAAGFDGVEIHSANGYLLDQFLQDGANDRTDAYGGSIDNRMRLTLEVCDRVIAEIGAGRVGIRLSPRGQANDITDSDPHGLFSALYKALDTRGLAYLHVVESFGTAGDEKGEALIRTLRSDWTGFYIANGEYDAERSAEAIRSGHADAVSVGKAFIANPDLPERFRTGAALNPQDKDTFYGGGAEGYTDYPFATLGRGDAVAKAA